MAKAVRVGDNDSGHDNCPPRPLATGSDNVFINNRRAGRIGDTFPTHSCDIHPPHTGAISSGSQTVFINNRRAGRIGDSVSCGGHVAQGSNNVMTG